MSSMMQKLSLLENKVKIQALEIERKVSHGSTHKGHVQIDSV